MKKVKSLNIRGALLDRNQLGIYIEKISAEHTIKNISNKDTYPIPKLKEDFKFILETYNMLSKHIKLGIKVHSAGEWILDNFYIIEETVKSVSKELSLKKYRKMTGIASGRYAGFARSYVLAEEIVAFTDAKIDRELIDFCLKAYQKKKLLSIDEICNIGIFLKISIISYIRELCEKIYISEVQKYKAESIIERLVEQKESNELQFLPNYISKRNINGEPKYPFIEYMSYKLKKYGKRTICYQEILAKEVQKIGLSISDVVQKEHFFIANTKISMGNSITSIKSINRINFAELYSYMNASEEILKQDPAGIYSLMDEDTKNMYRGIIEKISKKNKISEIYICEKIKELCKRYEKYNSIEEQKKSHVGYYLIDSNGLYELKNELEIKNNRKENTSLNSKRYIVGFFALTSIVCFLISFYNFRNILPSIIFFVLAYIPISEIVIRMLNYFMLKVKSPKIIPKMNYEKEIPDDKKTFVIIPTILKSKEKVQEMIKKMEVYSLANSSKNIYFALLGDVSESNTEVENFDDEVIVAGLEGVQELNKKYGKENFSKFHFLYRKRRWNQSEGKYIGWERKRGLIYNFNLYLKGRVIDDYLVNTIELEKNKLPKIKYVITLDSDTNLCLESAKKLIGAMGHILNLPIIKNKKVIDGYGIMQPRVGLDLENAYKTKFVRFFSMQGGIDCYTNAISDIYQDYFKEGIFTGKGIYDVEVYNEILENKIPANKVLSHDLLEGNYLRCALLTDVMLLDGYPNKYLAYIKRNHRWVRGDWQILSWLKENNFNSISKFKIFDNLRRSLVPIFSFFLFLAGIMVKSKTFIGISILSIIITYLIEVVNYIIFKESTIQGAVYASKKYSKDFGNIIVNVIRICLSIFFWPYEAYENLDSIIRSIYRMKNNKKLLEWTTAEDGEKQIKSNLFYYFNKMKISVIVGVIIFFFNPIVGGAWIISPVIAWYISKEKNENFSVLEKDKKYLLEIAEKTWHFFESNMNEENHFLIIDNYQEDRVNKVVNRTSSTNIGLELISIISAYDLGFINYKKCIDYLKKVIETVNLLDKWNGHLYNWYDTKTLKPLIPRYISTVDSGNFVGYLYIVKYFLIQNRNKQDVENFIQAIENLINSANFSELYSPKDNLLSIGYNLEENKLTDSYYDFLASEARQASLVAIAKKDIPVKHWNHLSRTLTPLKKYKGLVSWTGTAFEYLMPNINIKRYKGSLLDESSKFAIMSQMEYSKSTKAPWGISESAFNLRDLNNNYQYRAFGIPWLGLKRGLENDIVISPYSTFLSLQDEPKKSIENLKRIEELGGVGKFGFYEAIDYTKARLTSDKKFEIIKTFMAHHQGLTLISINNYLNDNINVKRFSSNPEIEAVNVLLEERMPIKMVITKENKLKSLKTKAISDAGYVEKYIKSPSKIYKNLNVLTNENYQVIVDDSGNSVSKYKDNILNSFKITNEFKQGIFFYVKNIRTKNIFETKNNSEVIFAPDKAVFRKRENNIKTEEIIFLDPNKPIEIHKLKIKNVGNFEEVLEIYSYFEPVLSTKMQEYSHPCFNKMFLNFEIKNENIIVNRKNLYLVTSLYTENEQIVDFEYEINKEKFIGRENFETPLGIVNHKKLSSEITTVINPILAMKRTIRVEAGKEANVTLIISVDESKDLALENLENIKSDEEIFRISNIAKVRSEEESKYLQVTSEKMVLYNKLLNEILILNSLKNVNTKTEFRINNLWKYGISGDNPIVLVKLKNIEDVYVVEELVNAFDYYRAKRIKIDLVILDDESSVYEKYVRENVNEVISNKQLDFLKNISGGVFILNRNEMELEDVDILEFKSNVLINASITNLESYLKDEDEKKNNQKKKELRKEVRFLKDEVPKIENGDLMYFNGFGGFLQNGKEYKIIKNKENKLPIVWSNILANNFFGTLVTDNLGGYTWSKNSRLNRLTAWSNEPILDFPSEIFYFKDEDKKLFWTLNSNVNSNNSNYYITNGFGYSIFENNNNNYFQKLEVFVPNEESLKILKFNIKNLSNEERKLKLLVYIKNVLGEDEYITNGKIELEKDNNFICAKNVLTDDVFYGRKMYVYSSEKINSFTGEKENFFGEGNVKYPDAYFRTLNNNSGIGKNSCIGMELKLEIGKFENKEFYIIIGEEAKKEKIKYTLNEINSIDAVNKKYEETKQKWNNLLSVIHVKTPCESLNILMNGWLIYQTFSSRLLGRTGYYQSGGAYGFRDQLQDAVNMKYIDISILENQIIISASHQFIEGDVLHWFHLETKKGVRTRFSDDLLWLVWAVEEYIKVNNNYDFLNTEVEYLSGKVLNENELEKYDIYYEGSKKESIFNHSIRAIECVLNRGIDPFPKIGTGDWNDGFSNIGAKGNGQSIWLGFFLYYVLKEFIPICKFFKRDDLVKEYEEIMEKLKKNINTKGWDGRWYKRAITDEAEEVGSISSEECRIDSICQSWSVISGAGDNDKKFIAMEELENYLIDRENKLIKLFDPPFEKSKINPGYIKNYPIGVRENGGQYTHAAVWVILAETLLGFGDKAVEFANLINPIEHSKSKEEAKRFKLEPYIMPADIYSSKDLLGWGGWNWYTGSSSWYYRVVLENILGFKIENNFLSFNPCISHEWKEYEIQFKFKTSIYNIKVKNLNGNITGVKKFLCNGEEIKDKKILLQNNGKINQIEIYL